jgi:hypothetical protein
LDTELLIAIISALVALGSGGLSLHGVRLAHRLEEQREIRSKSDMVDRLMSKYRNPLLRSAYDLQGRLYNIVKLDFLRKYYLEGSPSEKEYARENTLHVLGEYLGWVEILRREVQFLDLLDVERNRQFSKKLGEIAELFLTDKLDPAFRVFRGEQRALGEIMMLPAPASNGVAAVQGCIGYASFVAKRSDPKFGRWFEKLEQDLELLAKEPHHHEERLVGLQHALIDLIDYLDPDRLHFDMDRLARI